MIFYSVNNFFLIFQFQLLVTAKVLLISLSFCFHFHLPGFESQSWCLIKIYLSWDNIKPSSWPFTELYSLPTTQRVRMKTEEIWSISQNLEELQKCKNRVCGCVGTVVQLAYLSIYVYILLLTVPWDTMYTRRSSYTVEYSRSYWPESYFNKN